MSIRAVVFDIGDVLLLYTGGDKWTQRLGLSDEEFLQRLLASGAIDANAGRISAEEVFRRLGVAYQLEGEELQEFWEDVWALQEPNLMLIDFLHSLQPQYKTATLSNDFPGAREQQNRLFDLEDQLGVDVMFYSCIVVTPVLAAFCQDLGRVGFSIAHLPSAHRPVLPDAEYLAAFRRFSGTLFLSARSPGTNQRHEDDSCCIACTPIDCCPAHRYWCVFE